MYVGKSTKQPAHRVGRKIIFFLILGMFLDSGSRALQVNHTDTKGVGPTVRTHLLKLELPCGVVSFFIFLIR